MICSSEVGGAAKARFTRFTPPASRRTARYARAEDVGTADEQVEHRRDARCPTRARRRPGRRAPSRSTRPAPRRTASTGSRPRRSVASPSTSAVRAKSSPDGLDPAVELGQVEVLVLQRVRELVDEGEANLDVVEIGPPHEEPLLLLVVEPQRVGRAPRSRDDWIRSTGPSIRPNARSWPAPLFGLGAVPLRDLRVVTLVGLHEGGVGEELHRYRVLELELAVPLDELDVPGDPGVPASRAASLAAPGPPPASTVAAVTETATSTPGHDRRTGGG